MVDTEENLLLGGICDIVILWGENKLHGNP